MSARSFLLILVAFVFSVGLRAPHLDRPLSAHHEFCTALTLIVLHIWAEEGIGTHHGTPAVTFGGEADRHIAWATNSKGERDGRYYYLSHPPLAYYLPHLMFSVLSAPPSAMGLQLFNLLFHLTTALCLYLLVRRALPGKGEYTHAPMAAALFYLFMPAPLWFHSNAYMSDMLVVSMWAFHLLAAQRLFARQGEHTTGQLALYGLTLALTVYTSWLGVFAAAVSAGTALGQWRRRGTVAVLITTVVAVMVPLALMACSYGTAVGGSDLLAYLQGRFGQRSSLGATELGVHVHLLRLLENYRTGFLPVLLLAGTAWAAARLWRQKLGTHAGGLRLFALLAGLPVLLEHVVLLEYADHDFVALKGGLLLCGFAALFLERVLDRFPQQRVVLRTVVLSFTLLAGAAHFVRLNPYPGMYGIRYDMQQRMGRTIATATAPDEVVFALGFKPEPQVVWYAMRTPMQVGSREEAVRFLEERGIARGQLFRREGQRLEVEPVSAGAPH